jgi:hypothetical protein
MTFDTSMIAILIGFVIFAMGLTASQHGKIGRLPLNLAPWTSRGAALLAL